MFNRLLFGLRLHMGGLSVVLILCTLSFGALIPPVVADTAPTSDSCGISSTSLPVGTVGDPYTATLQAGGGTLPYAWSIVSGALPTGLALNGVSGVISGTPVAARVYSFAVRADDSAMHYCTMSISIQVNPNAASENLTTVQTLMISKVDSLLLSAGVITAAKELASPDGRVKLGFAGGTAINMKGLTQLGAAVESNPPATTDNSTMVRAYSFIPSGATFSPAATLTLRYDVASLPAGAGESGLYLACWSGSAWEQLSSTVNITLKEVSAPVAHFTTFAIRCPVPSTGITAIVPTTTVPTTAAPANSTVSAGILGTSTTFVTINSILTSAATLSSAGGKMVISLADNTTVNLPAGNQQITVIQLASPPAAPEGARLVEAYAFGPDNTTFTPALTVTVKYDSAGLPAGVQEANLYIAVLESSGWTTLAASAVNIQARTVSAQISHFSTFALLGTVKAETPAPATPPPSSIAAFSVSDLTVSPETIAAGEQVVVSVRVVNGGTGEGSKTVVLKVNDQDEAQKDVTLTAGKSLLVSFNVSKVAPGQYRVSVDGQAAGFTVVEAAAKAPDGMSVAILVVIIAGGLLVILLVVIMVLRQRSGGY